MHAFQRHEVSEHGEVPAGDEEFYLHLFVDLSE